MAGAPSFDRFLKMSAAEEEIDSTGDGLPWLLTTSSVQQQETEELVARYVQLAEARGLELTR